MPTLIYLDGFEHRTTNIDNFAVTGAGVWDATGGTPTIVAGKNGQGLQVAPSAASVWMGRNIPGTAPTVSVVSFYVKFTVLPTIDSVIFAMLPGTGIGGRLFFKTSTGKFHLAISATASGTDVGPAGITTGIWYKVDLKFNVSANPWTLDGRIDEGTNVQVTSGVAAGTCSSWRFGADQSSTYTAQYDDFVASNTAGDFPIAAHKVLPLYPNADGSHSTGTAGNFKDQAGTNITDATTTAWNLVDDLITGAHDGATTGIVQAAIAGTNYVEIAFTDTAEATIWGATGGICSQVPAITANNATWRVVNAAGTTVVDLFAGDPSISAAPHWACKLLAANPSSTTVSGYKFRFGFSSDATPNPEWTAAFMQIAVPVGGATPVALAVTSTFTATLAVLSLYKRALAVASTFTPVLAVKQLISRTLAVTSTFTAALNKMMSKTLNVGSTFTAAITSSKVFSKLLEITSTFTPALVKLPNKVLAVTSTFTPAIARLQSFFRALAVTSTFTPTLSRLQNFFRTLGVTSVFTPVLAVRQFFFRALAVTSAFVVGLVKGQVFNKLLAVASTFAPVMGVQMIINRVLAATSSFVASLVTLFTPAPPPEGGDRNRFFYMLRRVSTKRRGNES